MIEHIETGEVRCHVCAEGQRDISLGKNTGDSHRKGAVKNRVQAKNPVTGKFVKIDTATGRIIDHKKTTGPYKGVRDVSRKK